MTADVEASSARPSAKADDEEDFIELVVILRFLVGVEGCVLWIGGKGSGIQEGGGGEVGVRGQRKVEGRSRRRSTADEEGNRERWRAGGERWRKRV